MVARIVNPQKKTMSISEKSFYRRRLPHFQPNYSTFFITCRLFGSLPKSIIVELLEEKKTRDLQVTRQSDDRKKKHLLSESHKKYFGKFDTWLSTVTSGPHWMKEEHIAQVIADSLHYRDGKVFDLLCFCIMPNHIHVVFYVGPDVIRPTQSNNSSMRDSIPLYKIMHSFKRYTALECNHILGRSGSFWQAESYDHVIRDGHELDRIISYTLNNPVAAGLCHLWNDWKWSYLKKEFVEIFL